MFSELFKRGSASKDERLFYQAHRDLEANLYKPLRDLVAPYFDDNYSGVIFFEDNSPIHKGAMHILKPEEQNGEWRVVLEEPNDRKEIALIAFSNENARARLVDRGSVNSLLTFFEGLKQVKSDQIVRTYERPMTMVEADELCHKVELIANKKSTSCLVHLGSDIWTGFNFEPVVIYTYINLNGNNKNFPFELSLRYKISSPDLVEPREIVRVFKIGPKMTYSMNVKDNAQHFDFIQISKVLDNSI